MSTKSMRIWSVISGALLITAGIYCLCNQDVAVMSAGLLLGVFMLISGIAEIVVFAGTSGLLLNQWFTLMSLPFLFTAWLLFSGVSRFVSAFDLKALGVRAWGWVLALGIVLTVAGFVCMMDPWVSVAAMGVTVGVVFLLEGVSAIFYGCITRTKL